MAERLEAELVLDIDSARSAVETLKSDVESQLSDAIGSFGDEFAKTVSDLPAVTPSIETDDMASELQTAVTGAIDSGFVGADGVINYEGAELTSSVTGAIDTGFTEADGVITYDGGELTSTITSAIDEGFAGTQGELFIDQGTLIAGVTDAVDQGLAQAEGKLFLDTEYLASEIETAVAGANAEVLITADLSEAEDAIAGLGEELADVGDTAAEGGSGLAGLETASHGLALAFTGAKLDAGSFKEALTKLPGGLGAVAGATVGLTAGFVALEQAGMKSLSALQRVETILGPRWAKEIESIDVGGLSGGLSDLAIKAGSSAAQLRNADASMAQMGLSSGKSKEEVTDFAEKVNALSLRAVALNPSMGEAGAVAERFTLMLARGGPRLAKMGIDLNAAEIRTRALADTGKTAASDLTIFEKAMAGASLATEKLGDSLGKDFEKGTKQAAVQMKALKAEINSAFAGAGRPLVQPTIDALHELVPAATTLSEALGKLAQDVMPAFTVAMEALGPPLKVVAMALDAIPAPVIAGTAAMLGLHAIMGPLGGLIGTGAEKLLGFGANMRFADDATLAVSGKMQGLSGFMQNNTTALAGLATGAMLTATSFDGMGKSTGDSITGIVGMTVAGASLGSMIPGVGTAVGAAAGFAAGGITTLAKSFLDSGESAEDLKKKVAGLAEELSGLGGKAAAATFLDEIGESLDSMSDKFRRAGQDTATVAKEFHNNFQVAGRMIGDAKNQVEEFRTKFAELAEQSPGKAQAVLEGLKKLHDEDGKPLLTPNELKRMNKELDEGREKFKEHAANAQVAASIDRQLASEVESTVDPLTAQKNAAKAAAEEWAKYIEGLAQAGPKTAEFADSLSSIVPTMQSVYDQARSIAENPPEAKPINLQKLIDSMNQQADQMRGWGPSIQALMDQGLTGLANIAREKGPLAGVEFANAWLNAAPGMAQAAEDAVTNASNAAIEAQVEAGRRQVEATSNFAANLSQMHKNGWDSLVQLAMEKGPVVGAAMAQAWLDADPAIVGALNQVFNDQKTGTTNYAGWVQTEGAKMLGDAHRLMGQHAAQSYADAYGVIPDKTGYILDENTGAVIGYDPVLAEKLYGTGSGGAAAYGEGVSPIPGTTADAMAGAEGAIAGSGVPGAAGSQGGAASDQWGTGIAGVGPGTETAMGTAKAIVEGAKDIGTYAYFSGLYVGQQLAQGIEQGIRGQIGDIEAAAREAIVRARDAAQKKADANSPSRLFMPIGSTLAEGLAVGFSNQVDATGGLADTVGDAILTAADGATEAAEGSVQRGYNAINRLKAAQKQAEANPDDLRAQAEVVAAAREAADYTRSDSSDVWTPKMKTAYSELEVAMRDYEDALAHGTQAEKDAAHAKVKAAEVAYNAEREAAGYRAGTGSGFTSIGEDAKKMAQAWAAGGGDWGLPSFSFGDIPTVPGGGGPGGPVLTIQAIHINAPGGEPQLVAEAARQGIQLAVAQLSRVGIERMVAAS